ncbi:MAG: hypothetical protein ACTMKV_00740 [Sphingomonas parapaucimobilis]
MTTLRTITPRRRVVRPGRRGDYSFDSSYDASTPLYLQLIAGGSYVQSPIGTLQPTRARDANVGVPQQPSIGKVNGNRLTLDWHPAEMLTVKSITAYRTLTQTQFDNGSAATTMSTPSGVFSSKNFAGAATQARTPEQPPVQRRLPRRSRRARAGRLCGLRADPRARISRRAARPGPFVRDAAADHDGGWPVEGLRRQAPSPVRAAPTVGAPHHAEPEPTSWSAQSS